MNSSAAINLEQDPDQVDIAAAKKGQHAAFERIYRRHSGWLYGLCWRLAGGDRGLAEDWLQDAFVQAWNKLAQYSGSGSFAGWIRRLTINLALQDKRLKRSRVHLESIDGQSAPSARFEQAAPQPPWPGADTDLENAIGKLPERARLVLVLYAIEGYSHEEIANMSGMAVGTSKAQLHRARQLVKDWLNNE